MKNKQTAVELLEKKLKTYLSWSTFLEEDFQEAKEMEKEQIKVSYGVGHTDGCIYMTYNKPDFEDQEQYYNITYKP